MNEKLSLYQCANQPRPQTKGQDFSNSLHSTTYSAMNKRRYSKERFVRSAIRKPIKRKSIISISKKITPEKGDEKGSETAIELIYVQIILALLLSLTAGILSVINATHADNQGLQDIEPPESQNFEGHFDNPMVPNLVVVYDEGIVMKFTFDKNFGIIGMRKLLKIPKSQSYFAYSYRGLLYLAYDKPTRKMTKYHPALSKSGFRLVEDSAMDLDDWNGPDEVVHNMDEVVLNVVQCGAKVWWLGKQYRYFHGHNCYNPWETLYHSYIWHQKRQLWKKGPKIEPQFLKNEIFCACSANRTSVMLIGFESKIVDSNHWYDSILDLEFITDIYDFKALSVFGYDFNSDSWTHFPNLTFTFTLYYHSCTAIVGSDKSGAK